MTTEEHIHITITPAKLTPSGQRYEARHGSDLLVTSRTPFLSAARALLGRGYSPNAVLTMSHAGDDTVAMRASLGTAAKLTVIENEAAGPRFGRYRPHPDEVAREVVSNRPRTAVREAAGRVAHDGIGAAL